MKRAAIYARFSTDKQNDRSCDDQVTLCRDLANRARYNVVAVYEDRAVSATSTHQRTGWQRLMQDASHRRFDVLLAEDQDRIARDEEDWHNARKRLSFADISVHTARGVVGHIEGSIRAMFSAHQIETLALHVRRGQAGAITRGRHMGGRCYGYRPVKGEPGMLAIDEAEAAIVRRVLVAYADGAAPRAIAAELNREKIPAPRGGIWNASTIAGSKKRQNGILNNALYDGRLIWNRQSFRKNPETRCRVSRPNAADTIVTREIPELRIVEPELWQRVQDRRASRGYAPHRYTHTRPRYLLSGLLKCGCCGSSYIVSGKDKRGTYLRCTRMVESGTCDNRRTIALVDVERRVIKAIETELAAPSAIAEFVRVFNRRWKELQDGEGAERRALANRLAEAERRCRRAVRLLIDQLPTHTLRKELIEAEAEREQLEATLTALPPSRPKFHPRAADLFREKVADLKAALAHAEPVARDKAMQAIRDMIEKIVVIPAGPYAPYQLEIHGKLAALLQASHNKNNGLEKMVAGVGFEPRRAVGSGSATE